MKFQPVIKWSGSKRSQSEEIISYFPKQINTYYEPFIGGASILYQLLHSDIKVNKYICSDINKDLIDLWNMIKDRPNYLSDVYEKMWNELNINKNLDQKKQYFNIVRKRFNTNRQPEDFLFISRTCVNGKIRYNKKNEFNNSFHVTRKGIEPKKLTKIIKEWSDCLNKYNVQFIYKNIFDIDSKNLNKDDFVYLDPPYAGTKDLYYGSLNDYNKLWNWLRNCNCKYALSFDGTCGNEDRTYEIPKDIYSKHEYIYSGISGFKKLQDKVVENVKESLYLN